MKHEQGDVVGAWAARQGRKEERRKASAAQGLAVLLSLLSLTISINYIFLSISYIPIIFL